MRLTTFLFILLFVNIAHGAVVTVKCPAIIGYSAMKGFQPGSKFSCFSSASDAKKAKFTGTLDVKVDPICPLATFPIVKATKPKGTIACPAFLGEKSSKLLVKGSQVVCFSSLANAKKANFAALDSLCPVVPRYCWNNLKQGDVYSFSSTSFDTSGTCTGDGTYTVLDNSGSVQFSGHECGESLAPTVHSWALTERLGLTIEKFVAAPLSCDTSQMGTTDCSETKVDWSQIPPTYNYSRVVDQNCEQINDEPCINNGAYYHSEVHQSAVYGVGETSYSWEVKSYSPGGEGSFQDFGGSRTMTAYPTRWINCN